MRWRITSTPTVTCCAPRRYDHLIIIWMYYYYRAAYYEPPRPRPTSPLLKMPHRRDSECRITLESHACFLLVFQGQKCVRHYTLIIFHTYFRLLRWHFVSTNTDRQYSCCKYLIMMLLYTISHASRTSTITYFQKLPRDYYQTLSPSTIKLHLSLKFLIHEFDDARAFDVPVGHFLADSTAGRIPLAGGMDSLPTPIAMFFLEH